ncbi:reverse transcriptase domain-containing protein [Tanacetum coccineum]
MKYQPLNFKGTEGVVGLSQWLKKMESVFHISGCAVEYQVKFATCTLLGAALTWWNGHVRTLSHDAAYAMTWEMFKKKLTEKYCLNDEIKKLGIELWNLKVKRNDVAAYTQRFQELALMCTKFLADEIAKIDKYVGGLPDNIHGNVMSARPKTLDFAIELANDLMDQKLRTYAERQAENKRKFDNNNQNQQQLLKKQNVVQAYAVGSGEKKPSDCPMLKNQGTVAYKLELPQQLSRVHNTFHVSNLKKCLSDESLVILLEELRVDDKLHFVEEPIEVMDREIKQLKMSRIPIIKVRWNSKRGPKFTWERKDQFKQKYPHLFIKTAPSSSAAS